MMPSPEPEIIREPDIHVRVLLFSILRERINASEIDISLESGSDTADLLRELIERHPGIRSYAQVTRLAVNEEYVDRTVELADGDEVALITPVSGG